MNKQQRKEARAESMRTALRPICTWTLAATLSASTFVAACSGAAKPVQAPPANPGSPDAPADHSQTAKTEGPYTIDDWWPNHLDLRGLKAHSPKGDPMDADFDYAKEFSKLDLALVKKDIEKLLTTSQDWWPADFGHYGGLMIRLAWHSSGTYRMTDGRGGSADGTIRFAPLNSWPDNVNLDKARRLLWPIKKKYGRSLSWADLMVLSGNVSLESMGFTTFGFAGGREDVYDPMDINWGPETEWLADKRTTEGGNLDKPLGATQMGLIYVNPEGPNGKPDPKLAAQHIRTAFGRMAMNDEETVALIAGGHTLGKAHGAAKAQGHMGPEPEAAPLEEQGLGWKNSHGTGSGANTITSGLEGAWTSTPARWSHGYFKNLFENEWELTKGSGGAQQWTPKNGKDNVPDAHDSSKFHKPMMFTTDLALKMDPAYAKISKRFYENPKEFEVAFAKAWYKLTHRDMGPHARLVGSDVPEAQRWQDPVPKADGKLVSKAEIANLKRQILASGLTIPELVRVAWASAAAYRDTDMRGGANGARIRLAPQKDWAVNNPSEVAKVVAALEKIQQGFNTKSKNISLADLIVLAGSAAVEEGAKQAGYSVVVPFAPGRTDATAEMTDVESFAVLEPKSDGFRNYVTSESPQKATEQLVERADYLALSAPEMTVLIGGLRVLGANYGGAKHGVFTDTPGTLNNDFFVNLLDIGTVWEKRGEVYEGKDRKSGALKWTATPVDLVFGSNSQLRAIAEVYAAEDAKKKFVDDFVASWTKVMQLDRFDLPKRR